MSRRLDQDGPDDVNVGIDRHRVLVQEGKFTRADPERHQAPPRGWVIQRWSARLSADWRSGAGQGHCPRSVRKDRGTVQQRQEPRCVPSLSSDHSDKPRAQLLRRLKTQRDYLDQQKPEASERRAGFWVGPMRKRPRAEVAGDDERAASSIDVLPDSHTTSEGRAPNDPPRLSRLPH